MKYLNECSEKISQSWSSPPPDVQSRVESEVTGAGLDITGYKPRTATAADVSTCIYYSGPPPPTCLFITRTYWVITVDSTA